MHGGAGEHREAPVSTRIGIVGMPNAGKSSLFNALTNAGAEAANYPFTTIEPNVAVVPVRDARLEEVAAASSAPRRSSGTRSTSTTSPGWSPARTRARASATASWRTSARPTRSCTSCARTRDEGVVHPEGRVDPLADIDTVETELALADLEQAERRVERVAKQARGGDRTAVAEEAWLREVIAALRRRASPCAASPFPPRRRMRARDLGSLTAKPVLFVANVDEGEPEQVPPAIAAHAAAQAAPGRGDQRAHRVRAGRARGPGRGRDARRARRQRVRPRARRARGVRAASS